MPNPTAEEQLELAKSHLDRVFVAAWDPVDWADIGNYGLYALEAAVMAGAKAVEIEIKPAHWAKSDAAVQLAEDHGLPDVSELMGELNDTRKAANYGDVARPDLDAEDVAAEIEAYVLAVEAIVTGTDDEDDID